MDNTLRVRSIECIGDIDREAQYGFEIERTASDAMLQGDSVQVLHDDERLPILLRDLVDRADIGMIKSGSSTSFAAEAFERLWIARDVIWEKLERDEASEFDVLGFVNHAHAAAAQFFQNAVMGNGSADHSRQILR